MIQTDSSKSGWGAFFNGVSTRGKWSGKQESLHIDNNSNSLANRQQACTLISFENGGTHDREVLHISKVVSD